ncbi:hypothetical protein SSTU70S_00937 [Stutzerimonas stutzeri]
MLFAPTLADKAILPTAWEGRYFFNRINEKLSFGIGPTLNRIDGELQSATLNGGRVKVKGDDTAVGFNAGVLYEFTPHTRMGVTYHSKVEYTLEGDTKLSGAGFGPFAGKYDASLDHHPRNRSTSP